VSLGNCTVIGEVPGVVVHGKVTFDHGLLMGIIHFEGEGATASCVEGSIEVKGDDIRFHRCDMPADIHGWTVVNVSGGKARFEHGGSLCRLTVVAGSVEITNVTGCEYGSLLVGPGPVNLNMADVTHYGQVRIDGMKGRLSGTTQTTEGLVIKNSVVEFDTFRPSVIYGAGTSLYLDNVIGSGSLDHSAFDHDSVYINNCQFKGMVYSSFTQRGGVGISNTTWREGSFNIGWGGPLGGLGLSIDTCDFENVSLSGRFPGPTEITSSNVSGKIGLHMEDDYNHYALTITKSRVVFLPDGSSSVPGPISISSSTVFFPESSAALVGASQLKVNRSTIQVTDVKNGSAIQIRGDIHMYNANIDVTNCSVPWVSQSFTKMNQIIV